MKLEVVYDAILHIENMLEKMSDLFLETKKVEVKAVKVINDEKNPYDVLEQIMTEETVNDLREHTEEYAAAFLKYTNLKPDQVVMKVQQKWEGTKLSQTIWFEPREGKNDSG